MEKQSKRGPGRPRSVDREAVVQAAMDHYWRVGPAVVSVNELCRKVGVSKPAMYRAFGGEDGLLLASLEHYRASVLVPRQAALTAEVPFPELLDRAIVALTSDLGTPAGCLFTRLRRARAQLGTEVLSRVEELEGEQLQVFERWYAAALERGEGNERVSATWAARTLDAQFASVLTQMVSGVPPAQIREVARLSVAVLSPGAPIGRFMGPAR